MRRIAIVLAALALAGCAASPRPAGSATLTLFGPDPRLDSWKTTVVEGAHVHPASGDDPCAVASMTCPQLLGPAYGGPDRLTAVLRSPANEALIVVLPRLKPYETDRVFRVGDISAAFERPLKTVEAVLDRGWVRAFRSPGGRTEFELFLVLKPARPGAAYESLQVVTRVEFPAR